MCPKPQETADGSPASEPPSDWGPFQVPCQNQACQRPPSPPRQKTSAWPPPQDTACGGPPSGPSPMAAKCCHPVDVDHTMVVRYGTACPVADWSTDQLDAASSVPAAPFSDMTPVNWINGRPLAAAQRLSWAHSEAIDE